MRFSASTIKIPALSSLSPTVKSRLRIGSVVVLVILGALGIMTDLFRSPRSVVADALARVGSEKNTEIRFIVDVRAPADPRGKRFHHLNFRAGPGPLDMEAGARPRLQFPFQLVLERRGVTVQFRGSTIIRDGAGYIRMTEMPAYGDLGKALEGRWVQVSDRHEDTPKTLSEEERIQLFRGITGSHVVQSIDRGGSARVRTVNARMYTIRLDDEKLRTLLRDLQQQFADRPGMVGVVHYLEGRLENARVDTLVLWIRPRTHQLVRARIQLIPRTENPGEQRTVVDATMLPRESGNVPEAPEKAVRLKPETVQRLFQF
ncbi:MAG: hypothetical protein G01um1014106_78 [Parcubacteria group bacterium Gr01-1014_106]|nr:MAG: hypothetical protein G01um1014106_78 [Parcubacteria group bacterium Gr01-1014_106]